MNDNMEPEGPRHAQALALINDLAILLKNASARGLEVYDQNNIPVYQFAWWAKQCDKQLDLLP